MAADDRKASPTRLTISWRIVTTVCRQRTPSSASPTVRMSARCRRAFVRLDSFTSLSFSSLVSLSLFLSAATWFSTSLSESCFSFNCAFAAASFWLRAATFSFLGPTSFATFEYVSMACVHMQRLFAALLCLPTESGVYSGFSTYFSSCFRTLAGMSSLSKVFSRSMNFASFSTRFAPSQSGFSCRRTFTASMVIITSGGGFAKDLISWMSFLSRLSRDFSAFSRAGIATSSSRWASSWMPRTSSACFRTISSSPWTFSLITSAFFCCSVTTGTSSSASLIFTVMNGASFVSSSCRPLTTAFASSILSTPFCRRRRPTSFSSRFSPSISR
mmetsp:Transcript_64667/g.181977  ORF Transcript_64667/g.181977 Transcript_64667/m.181977 type:complete len:330 (-) Transcript_64667:273-1262(-)